MAVYINIRRLPADVCERHDTATRYLYVLPDGDLPIHCGPHWCGSCRKVSDVEEIKSLVDLENEFRTLKRLAADIRVEAIFGKTFDRQNPPDHEQKYQLTELRRRISGGGHGQVRRAAWTADRPVSSF